MAIQQRPTKKGPYRVTAIMLRGAAQTAVRMATMNMGDSTIAAYARWQNLENEFAAERGISPRKVS